MSQSILELVPPKPDLKVKYGDDPLHFAEVRLPGKADGSETWPVVMNIHGGFWRSAYSLEHAGHLCAGLTKAGFATYNIEYRRVGDQGGGWPGSFEDVRNAYAFLAQQGKDFHCDPKQILVMGHSAGGQLALCLAGHEAGLTRVVSLAGVLDLEQAYAMHLSNDAVVEFLGGTPKQVPEHYREASPMKLKVAGRQAVIAGVDDDIVPPSFSKNYAAQKKTSGEHVTLIEVAKAGHFELIDPRADAFKIVLKQVQGLFS